MKTSMSQKKVAAATKRWARALPASFGNLFSFVNSKEEALQRISHYLLYEDAIKYLCKIKAEDISNITILMGVSEDEQAFQPILKINRTKRKPKYFSFQLDQQPTSTFNNFFASKQELNSEIAELFILHWQSLTNSNLINAFEGLTADKVETHEKHKVGTILQNHQQLRRVRKYIYTQVESQAMLRDIAAVNNPTISLYLGSGLTLPDFHPFSFRPIIDIKGINKSSTKSNSFSKSLAGSGSNNYYDTSKPCPPFCGM